MDVALGKRLRDPGVQDVPDEQALMEEQPDPLAEQLEMLEQRRLVLEGGEVLLEHDLLQLINGETGGKEARDDGPSRRPGNALKLVRVLPRDHRRDRAEQPGALDSAALKNEVSFRHDEPLLRLSVRMTLEV